MLDYERYAVFAANVLLLIGCYLVVRPSSRPSGGGRDGDRAVRYEVYGLG